MRGTSVKLASSSLPVSLHQCTHDPLKHNDRPFNQRMSNVRCTVIQDRIWTYIFPFPVARQLVSSNTEASHPFTPSTDITKKGIGTMTSLSCRQILNLLHCFCCSQHSCHRMGSIIRGIDICNPDIKRNVSLGWPDSINIYLSSSTINARESPSPWETIGSWITALERLPKQPLTFSC